MLKVHIFLTEFLKSYIYTHIYIQTHIFIYVGFGRKKTDEAKISVLPN